MGPFFARSPNALPGAHVRFYALIDISKFLFLAARRQSSWKRVGFPARTNTLARLCRRERPCGSEIHATWLEGLPKSCSWARREDFLRVSSGRTSPPRSPTGDEREVEGLLGSAGDLRRGFFFLEIQLRFHVGRWGGSDETTEGVSASGLLWVLSSGIRGFGGISALRA